MPALSLCAVTAASVLHLHRGGPCRCHSGPQIPGCEDRTEHDTEMYSGSGSQLYVLVPTRPGKWVEADPLLTWASDHREWRHARRVQRLQIKQRELSSHAGVRQPLLDIRVLLCQQLLHGAAQTPALCAKRQGPTCRLPAPGASEPWGPRVSSVTMLCDLDRPASDPRDSETRVHHQVLSFLCILPGCSLECIQF